MSTLVTGANGSQMAPVAQALLSQGEQVAILSRDPEKSRAWKQAGAEIRIGDLGDADSLREAMTGVEKVALHIPFFGDPSQSINYFKHAIDAARVAKVSMLVWNTSGTIPQQPSGNPAIDYRIEALAYLRASGQPFVALAPTGYAENLLSPWTTCHLQTRSQISYPAPADYAIGWLPTADLASMIVYALAHPELNGLVADVSGLEAYTGPELALVFSEALQRELQYYPMPPQEFGSILDEMLGMPGAGDGAASYYQLLWDRPDFRPPLYFDQTALVQQIPTPRTPLIDWIRQHHKGFSQAR